MANFNLDDYIDVNDRILRFWGEYPDGRIETELMSPGDDFTQCRYVARVYKHLEHMVPAATGWAFELAGGGGANRTSHEENCETSAIGRALANMGYATSARDRPSRQEMSKTQRARPQPRQTVNAQPTGRREPVPAGNGHGDEAPAMANAGQVSGIRRMWQELGRDEASLGARVTKDYAQERVEALTFEQAGEFITALIKEMKVEKAAV